MKSFNSILYVVEDPEAESVAAMKRAVSLAENNQARLSILCVAEEPRLGPFSGKVSSKDLQAKLHQRALEKLEKLLHAAGADNKGVRIRVCFGIPFIEIIREVLRNQHDLVTKLVGQDSHGPQRYIFGGTDQHLLRKCPCPVWIMVGDTRSNYRQILAAVDFDPWGEDDQGIDANQPLDHQIINIAASLATSDFAQLHLVHAWQPVTDGLIRVFSSELSEEDAEASRAEERRRHHDQLSSLSAWARKKIGEDTYNYLSPRLRLQEGDARDVIPDVAEELEADLVVMGSVGRTGIPGLLIGNTAEAILNKLKCSVLAIKPPGFITPVTLDESERSDKDQPA